MGFYMLNFFDKVNVLKTKQRLIKLFYEAHIV